MSAGRRVSFDHFWSGFDPDELLVPVFGQALGRDPTIGRGDITVTSVFWSRREKAVLLARRRSGTLPGPPRPARYRIWMTGENIRPPVTGFDLTLGFDLDDYGGRNLYLPLALTALAWPIARRPAGSTPRSRPSLTPQSASAPREPAAADRPKFACAFLGNAEPRRMYAIEALSRYRPVDVFGPLVGRPVRDKAAIAAQYRFVVCFENDLFPGYVTEKPVEAYDTGAIPLWSGIDAGGLLRPDAMVNQAEHSSIRSWVDQVADLDRSSDELRRMAAAPLFTHRPSLDPLIDRLRSDLGCPPS